MITKHAGPVDIKFFCSTKYWSTRNIQPVPPAPKLHLLDLKFRHRERMFHAGTVRHNLGASMSEGLKTLISDHRH